MLDIQNEETGQCFWTCQSCQSYARKFDKRMKNIEKRMQDMEEKKIPAIEQDMDGAKADITTLKTQVKKLSESAKESAGVTQSSITSSVLEEMRERESRRNNLVVHNLPEPGAELIDGKERIAKDIEKTQELLNLLEINLDVKDQTRFIKRLGQRNEDSTPPRPLLIGFKNFDSCTSILDQSPKLAEMDEPWSAVNVIRDLTKTQRKEEKKLRDDADARNAELSEQDKENWKWMVVGRRGERRIVKVALEEDKDAPTSEGGGRGRGRGGNRVSRRPRKRTSTR